MPIAKDEWETKQEPAGETGQSISRREALKRVAVCAYIAPATALLLTSPKVMAASGPPSPPGPSCPNVTVSVTNTGLTTDFTSTGMECVGGVPTPLSFTGTFNAGATLVGNLSENSTLTYQRTSDGAGLTTFGPLQNGDSFNWNGPG